MSQETQKSCILGNANGAQLPEEFNFLKVRKYEQIGRTGFKFGVHFSVVGIVPVYHAVCEYVPRRADT